MRELHCPRTMRELHCPRFYTRTCKRTHPRTHPRTHAHMHASTHPRIHARAHTHTHTHTLTLSPPLSVPRDLCFSDEVRGFLGSQDIGINRTTSDPGPSPGIAVQFARYEIQTRWFNQKNIIQNYYPGSLSNLRGTRERERLCVLCMCVCVPAHTHVQNTQTRASVCPIVLSL
jgi:hypothetical protein